MSAQAAPACRWLRLSWGAEGKCGNSEITRAATASLLVPKERSLAPAPQQCGTNSDGASGVDAALQKKVRALEWASAPVGVRYRQQSRSC